MGETLCGIPPHANVNLWRRSPAAGKMNKEDSKTTPNSNPNNTFVTHEDILARAEDRRNICRIMCWAHLYVSIRWSNANLYIGIPSTIFAAMASVQAISELGSDDSDSLKILHIVFSILVAGLAPLLTFLNPSERANAHKTASRIYEQLGDRYDEFLLKCKVNQQPLSQEIEELVVLNQDYAEIKKPLPITPEWAVRKAEKKAQRASLVATLATNHHSKI